jgi:hypothetical protein
MEIHLPPLRDRLEDLAGELRRPLADEPEKAILAGEERWNAYLYDQI